MVLATVLLIVGLVALVLPSVPAAHSMLVGHVERAVGAPPPPSWRAVLQRKLARRVRGAGAAWLLAGVLLALAAAGAVPGMSNLERDGFLLFTLLVAFGAAGVVVADLARPEAPGDGPRAARASAPGLGDYVARPMQVLAGMAVVVAAVMGGAALLLGGSRWFEEETLWRSPLPVLAVALPVVVVLAGVAVRRILDAPQPARDEAELYWQDAFRAYTLESLVLAVAALGLLGMFATGAVLDGSASTAAEVSGEVGPAWTLALIILGYSLPVVLCLAALLTVPLFWRRSETPTFRTRLWGGRPADEMQVGA